jgi:hypothetical protein
MILRMCETIEEMGLQIQYATKHIREHFIVAYIVLLIYATPVRVYRSMLPYQTVLPYVFGCVLDL